MKHQKSTHENLDASCSDLDDRGVIRVMFKQRRYCPAALTRKARVDVETMWPTRQDLIRGIDMSTTRYDGLAKNPSST